MEFPKEYTQKSFSGKSILLPKPNRNICMSPPLFEQHCVSPLPFEQHNVALYQFSPPPRPLSQNFTSDNVFESGFNQFQEGYLETKIPNQEKEFVNQEKEISNKKKKDFKEVLNVSILLS